MPPKVDFWIPADVGLCFPSFTASTSTIFQTKNTTTSVPSFFSKLVEIPVEDFEGWGTLLACVSSPFSSSSSKSLIYSFVYFSTPVVSGVSQSLLPVQTGFTKVESSAPEPGQDLGERVRWKKGRCYRQWPVNQGRIGQVSKLILQLFN